MTGLLYCQIAYAIAGLLFNMVSWRAVAQGKKAFTATDPVKGIFTMLSVLLITASYSLAGGWIYRIGWILLILRILPGGVIRHGTAILIDKNLENYASLRVGILAVMINTFGMIVGLAGLFLSFKNYVFPMP
ncbi:hypothetical protein [Sneathiella litorea]|uniref:Uncharacterized protein n=1 Tax=Sneathiella litorea TaxID=2606216 RepID=A0A6L8W5I5_9PROT|nr:hypothetical protein [Sneathiella litorea]MZR30405.1 hypothetical protein [Sneathiella litorea]